MSLSAALALLESMGDLEGPDLEEDLRRLSEFERTGVGVLWEDAKAWVDSWGTAKELPTPTPRKLR
jgi:hypothetical protein